MGRLTSTSVSDEDFENKILKALARGLVYQTAFKMSEDDSYRTTHDNQAVLLHPDSVPTAGVPAEWVVYHKFVLTGKQYLTCVSAIDPVWLVVSSSELLPVLHIY
jgi:HrpA-like RNA helicase